MSLANAVVDGLMARISQEQVTAAQPLAAVSQPATTVTAGTEGENRFTHPLCREPASCACQWEVVGVAQLDEIGTCVPAHHGYHIDCR